MLSSQAKRSLLPWLYTINPTLAQVVSKKSTRSALKLNGFLFH